MTRDEVIRLGVETERAQVLERGGQRLGEIVRSHPQPVETFAKAEQAERAQTVAARTALGTARWGQHQPLAFPTTHARFAMPPLLDVCGERVGAGRQPVGAALVALDQTARHQPRDGNPDCVAGQPEQFPDSDQCAYRHRAIASDAQQVENEALGSDKRRRSHPGSITYSVAYWY